MTEQEDVGGDWKRFSTVQTLTMNRTGLSGLIDRLVAWSTGEPQRTVNVKYTASVHAKGGEVDIKLWGGRTEEGPDEKEPNNA